MPYIKSKLDRWYEHMSESATLPHYVNISVSPLVTLITFCFNEGNSFKL